MPARIEARDTRLGDRRLRLACNNSSRRVSTAAARASFRITLRPRRARGRLYSLLECRKRFHGLREPLVCAENDRTRLNRHRKVRRLRHTNIIIITINYIIIIFVITVTIIIIHCITRRRYAARIPCTRLEFQYAQRNPDPPIPRETLSSITRTDATTF